MSLLFIPAACACIIYLITLIIFFMLHIKNKELNFIEHALSGYALKSTSKLFIIYLVIMNIGNLLLTLSIFLSAKIQFPIFITFFFICMIISRIGLGLFKTNMENEKLTFISILHYIFPIANFALMYTIIINVDEIIIQYGQLVKIKMLFDIYWYAITISLIGVCITMYKFLRMFFGIVERIYIILTNIWLIGISFFLFFINI